MSARKSEIIRDLQMRYLQGQATSAPRVAQITTQLRKRSQEFDEKEAKFKDSLEDLDTMDTCLIKTEENLVEWVLSGFPKPREPSPQPPPSKRVCLQAP